MGKAKQFYNFFDFSYKFMLGWYLFKKPLRGPIIVSYEITKKCNQRCRMCNNWEEFGKYKNDELTTREIEDVMKQIASQNVQIISLTGGEPLIREDILEVVGIIKNAGMNVHIVSNGSLLNRDMVKGLVEAGLDSITISIDGAKASTHNSLRGYKNAFEKAVEGVKTAIEVGKGRFHVGTNSVFMLETMDEIPDIVDLAHELGAQSVRLMPLHPVSPLPEHRKSIFEMISKIDRQGERIDRRIDKFIEKCKKHQVHTYSSIYLKSFREYFRNPKKMHFPCYAGYVGCIIDNIGRVAPCWAMPPIGDLKKESFASIWNSTEMISVRQKIRKGICSGCLMGCQVEPCLRFDPKYMVKSLLNYDEILREFRHFFSPSKRSD